MANVAISGDTSGAVTLTVPAVAGTNTITLGNQTGTLWAAGPAFRAYKSAATQSLTAATWTKVTFDVESFDTNNNFASSTFTPTVAGYYQISASVDWNGGSAATNGVMTFWKNGSEYARLQQFTVTNLYCTNGASLIYMNGSTDYVEVYVQTSQSGIQLLNDTSLTWFTGSLVRGA